MDPNEDIVVDEDGHCDVRYRGWERLDDRLFDLGILTLDLSHNNLTALPKSIGSLSGLKELNAACNNITSIDPDGIAKLKQLCTLKLNGNAISSLPSSIGQCKWLETLVVSENKLTEVPAALADCSSLRIIKLQHNTISELPLELHRLANSIEVLDVSGNDNLTMIPESVRDNATVIMWILSTHNKKIHDICKLEEASTEAKQRLETSRAEAEGLQKQIKELEEEKKLLEADISSVATYLRHRRRIDGYKATIRATRDTIRTMFELKADKVAAFS